MLADRADLCFSLIIMLPVRIAKLLSLALMLAAFVLPLYSQVTVYQDSATPEGGVVGNYLVEYGDEVNLTGTARIVTRLRFEYGGSFVPNGDEQARVRIYANDGPIWKGNASYVMPGTLLWESPIFSITNQFTVKDLAVPSIRVPSTFTWTIQIYGLTMSFASPTDPNIIDDFAGLSFYGLAEIGTSYNDFWQLLPVGWTPVRVGTVVKNNFSASVTAVQEVIAPDLQVTNTSTSLRLSWPKGSIGYALQSQSEPGGEWVNVESIAVLIGDRYQCNVPKPAGFALFRLKKAPIATALSVAAGTNGMVKITWPSSALGKVLQSKGTVGAAFWTDEFTPAAANGGNFEVNIPANSPQRIFRLRDETKTAALQLIQDGPNLRLRWPAEATGLRLQSKPSVEANIWGLVSSPVAQNGGYFEATVPIGSGTEIFRLVR